MGLGKTIFSSRWVAGWAVVLSCAMVQVLPAWAARQRHVELSLWEQAERGRQTLEAMPAGTRTRADYARAMDGFRAVYHEAPGDRRAPDSVNAVAELLAEQGRGLHDAKSLKAAVGQYEFLRTQYPGSSLRVGALLAEGQIYENDLQDAAAARERYALLVKQYPRSELAEEARAGLASLDQGVGRRDQGVASAGAPGSSGSSIAPVAAPVTREGGAGGMLATAGASDGRDAKVSGVGSGAGPGVGSGGQGVVGERQGLRRRGMRRLMLLRVWLWARLRDPTREGRVARQCMWRKRGGGGTWRR
ncbi:hypothetical protein RBB78_07900 [Tunturiibacter empetritectus]|uniref:tetratricopeptide repeat protein n=1 Tax=Tunturiibacter empetritectus TaxID=3069691 RepID=UPI003D9B07B5